MAKVNDGVVAEYALATELLKRGYMPHWPSGGAASYDLVVDVNRTAVRIQVKSTVQDKNIRLRLVSGEKMYTKSHADLLLLWVDAFKTWYVIPIKKIRAKFISLKPRSPRCKWAPYKEAWHLLETAC